jgi:hypothetical protein
MEHEGDTQSSDQQPSVGQCAGEAGSGHSKRFYCAFPSPERDLPDELAEAVHRLEGWLGLPACLIVQGSNLGSNAPSQLPWNVLCDGVVEAFRGFRKQGLSKGQKIALVIDSVGGEARAAYRLAKMLTAHCGGFVAVIPRFAKSAATLLALGADEIVMAQDAELGPLDVQYYHSDREELLSGLDEVQALERLAAFAMSAVDNAMFLLVTRTGMKARTVLPYALRFVTALTRPLFSKLDVVRYTQTSRALKVGEEYARRLLRRTLGPERADQVARKLVENYPEHAFIIDREEATELGLRVRQLDSEEEGILDQLSQSLGGEVAIGPIFERAQP